jgi:hypothetical protein
MRNEMQKVRILLIVVMLLLVTACADNEPDADYLIKKIEFNDLKNEVESYIDQNIIESGIYLINSDDKHYLLLSNRNVETGEEASYFSDVHAELSEGKLDIFFNEHFSEDYSDERLKDNMLIYLIRDNLDLEYILIHKNGVEVYFDTIFVI